MELTLMLQDRYAGRFQMGTGIDHPPLEGIYAVRIKRLNPGYGPGYRSAGASPVIRITPWANSGSTWAIKSAFTAPVTCAGIGQTNNRGSICLSERDIDNVYGILSIGSKVVIQR